MWRQYLRRTTALSHVLAMQVQGVMTTALSLKLFAALSGRRPALYRVTLLPPSRRRILPMPDPGLSRL